MAFVKISSQISVGASYSLEYFVVLFIFSKSEQRVNDQQHFLSTIPVQHFWSSYQSTHLEFSAFH